MIQPTKKWWVKAARPPSTLLTKLWPAVLWDCWPEKCAEFDQFLHSCNLPKIAGGKVDVVLGIQYLHIFPVVARQLDCCLTIFCNLLTSSCTPSVGSYLDEKCAELNDELKHPAVNKEQMEKFEEQLRTRSGIRLFFMASKKKVRNRASYPSENSVPSPQLPAPIITGLFSAAPQTSPSAPCWQLGDHEVQQQRSRLSSHDQRMNSIIGVCSSPEKNWRLNGFT
jgi:hypothetical protein